MGRARTCHSVSISVYTFVMRSSGSTLKPGCQYANVHIHKLQQIISQVRHTTCWVMVSSAAIERIKFDEASKSGMHAVCCTSGQLCATWCLTNGSRVINATYEHVCRGTSNNASVLEQENNICTAGSLCFRLNAACCNDLACSHQCWSVSQSPKLGRTWSLAHAH